MKTIVRKFVIWPVLLLGCLLPVTAPARDNHRHHKSGIIGVVNAGQFNSGLIPGVWNVIVSSATGEWVAGLETDEQGFFEVELNPGKYVLRPFYFPHPAPGQPLPNYAIMGPSKTVTVTKNRFTFVVLPTTSGELLPPIPDANTSRMTGVLHPISH